jgi:hypothetical protein
VTNNASDSYIAYGSMTVSGTESNVETPLPIGGTLSDLQVRVTTAPGVGASWTFTADINGTGTALFCSIAGAATTCSDSSAVTVVQGDTLDLDATPFSAPSVPTTVTWSVTVTP